MAQFAGTTATPHPQAARAADRIVVKPHGAAGAAEPGRGVRASTLHKE